MRFSHTTREEPLCAYGQGIPIHSGPPGTARAQFRPLFQYANQVELCLFDTATRRSVHCLTMPERTDQVWHAYLSEVLPGATLRLSGPRPL